MIAKLNAQIDEDPRAGDDYAVAPTESSSNKRKLIEGGEGVDVEVIKSAFAGRKEKGVSPLGLDFPTLVISGGSCEKLQRLRGFDVTPNSYLFES